MQWLAELCVRRPVFALMLIAAMVVAGGAAFLNLGVDRLPRMDMPTINVRTTYIGAAPEEMESEVSQILEDAVATVEGIDELRSISSEGQSQLMITFRLDRNIDAAMQDVSAAVGGVLSRLPRGIDPPVVKKYDTDSSPVMTLAASGSFDARQLYFYAEEHIKKVIESAKGVGEVSISGAADRAVQINIEARRLAAYGLTIIDVRDALARQNVKVPGGRVDQGTIERALVTEGRFDKTKDFRDLVVATVHGNAVRIRDIGQVVDGTKEVRTLARHNGRPAVILQVQRQSGANTIEVIEAIKEKLPICRARLPQGIEVAVLQDQSRYIKAALHEIQGHLIIGSTLASVVVLLFMRSWRSTLIAAVAIPASIIASFAMMKALNFTMNNVTMLALVLMVGVVIDDAIVVLENVYHWIEEKGYSPWEATIHGTREIGLAVLATTISLVIVFLPVSFLSSVTGRMLYEFGLTASVAILVSMLVSFTLTPMMCSRLLKPVAAAADGPVSRRGFYHWIEVSYDWCLRQSLRFRWAIMLLSLATIAANVPLYRTVKQDYIPTNVDESEFEVQVTLPEGASIATTDATVQAIEDELREIRGVRTLLTNVGSRGVARVNNAEIYVRIEDIETRAFSLNRLWREMLKGQPLAAFNGNYSQREVMQEIRERLKKYDDLRCSVRNQTSFRSGSPVDIDFVIAGPGLKQLAAYAEQLLAKVNETPGIVDVDTTLRLNKPELHAYIDRERAASLGVSVQEIADTLRIAVGGDDRVSRYLDRTVDDAYDVELRLVGVDRASKESISLLYVRGQGDAPALNLAAGEFAPPAPTTNGALTRLDNLVRFENELSTARIDHIDRQRMCAVRANVAPGYALADRLEAVHAAAEELGLPPQYTTRVIGRGRELERTIQDFVWTFVLSFIFMYIVLAAQFEHLIHPLTILFSLPLAVPFGLFSLWWGGETLNLYSAVGILVLFGVVKKASILQVDHINQLRLQGHDRTTAIVRGNRDRLRPILMTTIAFVAGMLPLLIGTGPGAEERRSIAVLAVGGQTLSLLLTLLAVPVLYTYFDDLGAVLARWFAPAAQGTAASPPAANTAPAAEPAAGS